jgi:hypothetical protein
MHHKQWAGFWRHVDPAVHQQGCLCKDATVGECHGSLVAVFEKGYTQQIPHVYCFFMPFRIP